MTDRTASENGSADRAPKAAEKTGSRRRARGIAIGVGVVLLLLVAAVAWVGFRALGAKDSLEKAQSLIGQLQDTVATDPAGAPKLASRIEHETGRSRELTSDVVWRAAEVVPVLGKNLTVVRELAASVDDVAAGVITPLAAVAPGLDPADLKPVDGRIDLAPLVAATAPVQRADDTLHKAVARVEAIDTDGTIGQLRDAQAQLAKLLGQGAELTTTARQLVQLVPPMLGADGPRNYLLVFQNNAEARSLGGNAASLLLLTVDDGRLQITQQASSQDFRRSTEPPIPLDPNIYTVYYPQFPNYVQDIATRPDFPTMAQLGRGWWQRQFGLAVDGVVSFDPVALASLLDATGPIGLPTGETLTSANAVQLLLSDAYVKYPDPDTSDAFFASAAASIFSALTNGSPNPGRLLAALGAAADQHRFLAWSSHPEEQEILATTPLAGTLPSDNSVSTTLGVYFDDQSASKIDYWVDSAVTATAECSAGGPATYTATFSLSSRLTAEQADALPSYVVSGWAGPQLFRTDVYVLGPVGGTLLDTAVGVPGLTNEVLSSGTDLGRPILRLATNLAPAGSTTVTVRFQLPEGATTGPLAVQTTPMVNPTSVHVRGDTCGGGTAPSGG